MDADFAIVSLEDDSTVTEKTFFAKHKQSLYLGQTFPCMINTTINNGKVIYDNGRMVEQKGQRSWLKGFTSSDKVLKRV
ncbi:hypothetical protein JMM81_08555 [Bacillus sp. V3B]|uniref:hypothetical protein n=1 Tax=Bacillus sp. V3B TaxID=2804915 RepID=UPI00210C5232|nr:hypothetical protein [Bacillus sp. V3B]MCQ6275010.1 hypothetical protein [Bacillus sp. V3B]